MPPKTRASTDSASAWRSEAKSRVIDLAGNGDSGGPLFIKGPSGLEQVGIVSWGEGPMDEGAACGHANAYGIYTRLAHYTDWVKSKMGK